MSTVGKERIPTRLLKWSFKCTVNLYHFKYLPLPQFSRTEKSGERQGSHPFQTLISKNRTETKHQGPFANASPTPQNQVKQD